MTDNHSNKRLKVYLAAPFGSKAINVPNREYGEITDTNYINFLLFVESIIVEEGMDVHLPHRDTNKWGKVYVEPEDVVRRNWEEVASCDILVAYPKRSRGVHIEIGWASALKKKLILLLDDSDEASEVATGLASITTTIVIRFNNIDDLKLKLRGAIKELL